jgi:hypothetical protein
MKWRNKGVPPDKMRQIFPFGRYSTITLDARVLLPEFAELWINHQK